MSRLHETQNTELHHKIVELGEQLLHAKQSGRVLNEAETELYVINPLLSVLGYNTFAAIAKQSHDKLAKGYPDYTLLPGTPHEWFLEVKRLDLPLNDGEAAQAVSYAVSKGATWAVLTNGRAWYFYRAHLQKPLNEKRVFQIDDLFAQTDAPDLLGLLSHASMTSKGLDTAWTTKQHIALVCRELLTPKSGTRNALRRLAGQETGSTVSDADIGRVLQTLFAAPIINEPQQTGVVAPPVPPIAVEPAPVESSLPVSSDSKAPDTAFPPPVDVPSGNWKTLDELRRDTSLTTGRKPTRVLLGRADIKNANSWSEVAQRTVQFLGDNYGLPALPYALPGREKYFLNREPRRADGQTMFGVAKVIISGEPIFVDTHHSASSMVTMLWAFATGLNAPLDAVCVEVSPKGENEND